MVYTRPASFRIVSPIPPHVGCKFLAIEENSSMFSSRDWSRCTQKWSYWMAAKYQVLYAFVIKIRHYISVCRCGSVSFSIGNRYDMIFLWVILSGLTDSFITSELHYESKANFLRMQATFTLGDIFTDSWQIQDTYWYRIHFAVYTQVGESEIKSFRFWSRVRRFRIRNSKWILYMRILWIHNFLRVNESCHESGYLSVCLLTSLQ